MHAASKRGAAYALFDNEEDRLFQASADASWI